MKSLTPPLSAEVLLLLISEAFSRALAPWLTAGAVTLDPLTVASSSNRLGFPRLSREALSVTLPGPDNNVSGPQPSRSTTSTIKGRYSSVELVVAHKKVCVGSMCVLSLCVCVLSLCVCCLSVCLLVLCVLVLCVCCLCVCVLSLCVCWFYVYWFYVCVGSM